MRKIATNQNVRSGSMFKTDTCAAHQMIAEGLKQLLLANSIPQRSFNRRNNSFYLPIVKLSRDPSCRSLFITKTGLLPAAVSPSRVCCCLFNQHIYDVGRNAEKRSKGDLR